MRQIIQLLAAGGLVIGVLYYFVAAEARNTIFEDIRNSAIGAVDLAAAKLEMNFNVAQQAVNAVDVLVENELVQPDEFLELLRGVLVNLHERSDAVYGMAIALTPDDPDEAFPKKMYYVHLRDGIPHGEMIGGEAYPYMRKDWFIRPRELGRGVWTEPYYDAGAGDAHMTTYSLPIHRKRNGTTQFIGVATVDLELGALREAVAKISSGNQIGPLLISRSGTFISHPDPDMMFKQSIFSLADEWRLPELRAAGHAMVGGGRGSVSYVGSRFYPGRVMLCYAPVPSAGWSAMIVFPYAELYARLNRMNWIFLFTGIVGAGALSLLVIFIARRVSRPLLALCRSAEDIGRGNFTGKLPEYHGADEIGQLTGAFASMQHKLLYYTRELAATTAARQKIESELMIAQEIQQSLLPKMTAEFSENPDFALYTSLRPAREVGGDLYDFFFVGENRLMLIIGDVSGKGVPAALFMGMTQITQRGERGESTGELVGRINRLLCRNNQAAMFVTYFAGIIDLKTGELTYTNAGHNPPGVLRHGGGIEMLNKVHGLPLAIADGDYDEDRVRLEEHDVLFLYTDGVTEAMNADNVEYSCERLCSVLKNIGPGDNPIEAVELDLQLFVGDTEQSDDITMLAFRLNSTRNPGPPA